MAALKAVNVSYKAGKMYEHVPRRDLLMWVNLNLKSNFTRVEHLCTGAAYCQLMDILFPNCANLQRVKFFTNVAYEFVQNFKVLQDAFKKMSVFHVIPVQKLVQGGAHDNMEFLQWFKGFYDMNYTPRKYDPIAVRQGAPMGYGPQPSRLNPRAANRTSSVAPLTRNTTSTRMAPRCSSIDTQKLNPKIGGYGSNMDFEKRLNQLSEPSVKPAQQVDKCPSKKPEDLEIKPVSKQLCRSYTQGLIRPKVYIARTSLEHKNVPETSKPRVKSQNYVQMVGQKFNPWFNEMNNILDPEEKSVSNRPGEERLDPPAEDNDKINLENSVDKIQQPPPVTSSSCPEEDSKQSINVHNSPGENQINEKLMDKENSADTTQPEPEISKEASIEANIEVPISSVVGKIMLDHTTYLELLEAKSKQDELQMDLNNLTNQRDFYYDKCITLENLCIEPNGVIPQQDVLDVLYASKEGFGLPCDMEESDSD